MKIVQKESERWNTRPCLLSSWDLCFYVSSRRPFRSGIYKITSESESFYLSQHEEVSAGTSRRTYVYHPNLFWYVCEEYTLIANR